ncbi:MAG: glycosyltransferase family 39 protein [Polyangiaceae bacterium]|nr:glycosyltransferase family 39 protein [Polyangiaceae bacterium]MCW5792137.1 glycosyltransferase family 39 protein [Polyangiaceae bacterium]
MTGSRLSAGSFPGGGALLQAPFEPSAKDRLVDWSIALLLLTGYVWLLLVTTDNLGYARDEGFYFQASKSYAHWFQLLLKDGSAAMAPEVVDRYWRANNEHPALIKSLFALSYQYLYLKFQLFAEEGTAFRFPGMVLSGGALSVTYLWARRVLGVGLLGRLSALAAAVMLGAMPRVFYHAHLSCFDMPVLTMWLVTTYAYWRAAMNGRWSAALLSGVLYGLLLNTKHNSWLLPFALLPHLFLLGSMRLWVRPLTGRAGALKALFCMGTLGPLVFYAGWPWIWRDTIKRLTSYAQFHLKHDYYNMEFLGHTYWEPPMPRGYAPVMTLATVPTITWVLALLGVVVAFRGPLLGVLARLRGASASSDSAETLTEPPGQDSSATAPIASTVAIIRPSATPARPTSHLPTFTLWALCVLISYAPWLRDSTPIFGGTKHWIQAYPFLCLFGGLGLFVTTRHLTQRFTAGPARAAVMAAALACVLTAPVLTTWRSHPWGLSAYVPLVGGAPGAATLGLNRTFWGYTTGSAAEYINREAPPGARIFIHDTAHPSWQMMVKDGRLRRDLRVVWRPSDSDIAIYHHEPHMLRVEYQLWVAYQTTRPAWVGTHHGVPVVWVYQRGQVR